MPLPAARPSMGSLPGLQFATKGLPLRGERAMVDAAAQHPTNHPPHAHPLPNAMAPRRYLLALAGVALAGITTQAIVDFLTPKTLLYVGWPSDCRMTRPRPTYHPCDHCTVQDFPNGPQEFLLSCSDGDYKVPVDIQPEIDGKEQYSMALDPRRVGHRL